MLVPDALGDLRLKEGCLIRKEAEMHNVLVHQTGASGKLTDSLWCLSQDGDMTTRNMEQLE